MTARPLTLSDLWASWPWRPIHNCPGRFSLAVDVRVPLSALVGDTLCERHRVASARDAVMVVRLGDGGLISYLRPDGTILHTLNTAEGFERKLQQLGIEVSGSMSTSPIDAFGRSVPEYLSGRPDYPDALLGELPRADVIVELGAGTGKLTRLLARTGARIIAVEPQPAMAAHIPAAANVEVVEAVAERLPLPAASADLICCATAFHWFDYDKATAEILRIARPGAHLALIWNVRDGRTPWVGEVNRLLESYRARDVPRRDAGGTARILGDERFELVRATEQPFAHRMPPGGIVDRVLSTSYIGALPEAERDTARRKVHAIVAAHPELASAQEIDFPYVCKLYLLRCRQ